MPATPRPGRLGAGAANVRVFRSTEPSAATDQDVVPRDQLERGFRRLPPEQSAVLVLHHYLG